MKKSQPFKKHPSREQTWDILLEVLDGKKREITPDVLVRNGGIVFVFYPLKPRAKQWFDANVASESWQRFGEALVVEHRFAWALAQGLKNHGLRLA